MSMNLKWAATFAAMVVATSACAQPAGVETRPPVTGYKPAFAGQTSAGGKAGRRLPGHGGH